MMATPFIGMWIFAFARLPLLQAVSVVVVPFVLLAWIGIAVELLNR
jgi:hypothetical protein